ncbi:MAG: polysaccharide deacetylase family protein, partial [Paramuribaculum sp.]|nr:polysaccharide deacetylase family protein [Paramuribaculum sp.]
MFIEQPPLLYRLLFPEAIWRVRKKRRKVAYLTFDDGPVPQVTPWVLDTLDKYGVKATFFLVGDNVRRSPHLFDEIKRRGHSWGNHTMHHLQGFKVETFRYMRD